MKIEKLLNKTDGLAWHFGFWGPIRREMSALLDSILKNMLGQLIKIRFKAYAALRHFCGHFKVSFFFQFCCHFPIIQNKAGVNIYSIIQQVWIWRKKTKTIYCNLKSCFYYALSFHFRCPSLLTWWSKHFKTIMITYKMMNLDV